MDVGKSNSVISKMLLNNTIKNKKHLRKKDARKIIQNVKQFNCF